MSKCISSHLNTMVYIEIQSGPDTSQRQQRWLLSCPLVIALVPLKCSRRNLQFPHRLPLPRRKCLGVLALSNTKHTGQKITALFHTKIEIYVFGFLKAGLTFPIVMFLSAINGSTKQLLLLVILSIDNFVGRTHCAWAGLLLYVDWNCFHATGFKVMIPQNNTR